MQAVGKRQKERRRQRERGREIERERLRWTRPLCTAQLRRFCWTLASGRPATSTASAEIQAAAWQLDSDAAALWRRLHHCTGTKHVPCTLNNVWCGTKMVQCGSAPGSCCPSYWPKPPCMRSICTCSLLTQCKWIIHQSPFISNRNLERKKKKKKTKDLTCKMATMTGSVEVLAVAQLLLEFKIWTLGSVNELRAHSPIRMSLSPPAAFKKMIPLRKFHLPIWLSRIPLVIPL